MKLTVLFLILVFSFPCIAFGYNMAKEDDSCLSLSCKSDFDRDGVIDTAELIKKESGDVIKGSRGKAILQVTEKGKIFKKEVYPVSVENCGLEVLIINDNVTPFIALCSHAKWLIDMWEITIYRFNGEDIKGEVRINSDGSSVEVKDVDGDGVKDIVAACRDSDNDPKTDRLVQTYKYIDKKWRLTSVYCVRTSKELSVDNWLR